MLLCCIGGLGACPHDFSGFRPLETTFSSNLVTIFTGAGISLMTCKFRREGEGRVGGGQGDSGKEGYSYIHSIPHFLPRFPFEKKGFCHLHRAYLKYIL